ncbi:DUF4114 domain-containing protein [Eilatimonas milleporae]|uniref:DUF4114 domain-containing protein n=1 Tax=Eilatimonas milleporae TaxID=911205 RepID=UPI0014755CD3|nr:DUF4114 domain-containing protein [Eilatimonas milleporae]
MKRLTCLSSALLMAALAPAVSAGTVSPVQSYARPFGLEPIGDVQLAGSDEQAADFYNNALPDLRATVNTTLTESQPIENLSSIALNPNDLYLATASDVRMYFIGEGAGYRNTFGVYTGDSSNGLTGDAQTIFPDASTSSYYYNPDQNSYRSSRAPVAEGDFVELGTYDGQTQMNLFLIANGASGGTTTYYTDMSLNPDGIEHFVVLATPNSPYLVVGAEDLFGGGDEDYNDIVVALDIGVANAQQMISNAVPLPGPVAALIAPLFLVGWVARRRRRRDSGFSTEMPA